MKEHLIFNDQSLPFADNNSTDNKFPIFLEIIEVALKNGFKTIRFSDHIDKGWFQIQLNDETTLGKWLAKQSNDYRIKVKSFIQKTVSPLFIEDLTALTDRYDLSEFCLSDDSGCKTQALGACYFFNQLAVSCLSDDKWNTEKLSISIKELTASGENILITNVSNCATINHWKTHFIKIDAERKTNLKKGKNLWLNKEKQFPHLTFCSETKKQLTQLSISDTLYNQLWENLTKLNHYIELKKVNYTLEELKAVTGLEITDESDSVKQNKSFRRKREFKINEKRVFFGHHIKNFSSAFRMHIYIDKEIPTIHIGYFGKHLPTKKNK